MISNLEIQNNHYQLNEFERSLYKVVKIALADTLDSTRSPSVDEYVGVEEAMQILGIKRTKLYHLQKQGALHPHAVGRKLMFKRSELLEYIENH